MQTTDLNSAQVTATHLDPTSLIERAEVLLPLASRTPAEIDAVLFPLWARRWALAEAIARLSETRDSSHRLPYRVIQDQALLARYRHERQSVEATIDRLEAEYHRRGGWSRYHLVANNNGHLHVSRDCSTCYPTTQFLLIAESSGLDEDSLIERYATVVCSVCFPDAPSTPAYARGIARSKEEAAARAAGFCSGSGQRANTSTSHRYGTCSVCGTGVSITHNYKARQHKSPTQVEEALTADPKKLQTSLQFKGLNGWRVETVAGAKEVLRESVEVSVVAGTTFDHNGYQAGRLEESVAVYNAAVRALLAKGVTQAEIDKLIATKTKAVKKEYGL